jgi:hypothetical protein
MALDATVVGRGRRRISVTPNRRSRSDSTLRAFTKRERATPDLTPLLLAQRWHEPGLPQLGARSFALGGKCRNSKEALMAIVAGFDAQRRQITFDALETETGEVSRGRIDATSAAVVRWARRFSGHEVHVAMEACTGWLFVCDALVAAGGWGAGFTCRFCGIVDGGWWQIADGLRRCAACRSETSVRRARSSPAPARRW